MRVSENGFTIIEVTIFLAISGLLLLMVFMGSATLASQQRFTDSTDSLQSYLQSQYEGVVNGVNVRSGTNECAPETTTISGTSERCLLLGKVLKFDAGMVTSQYVISRNQVVGSFASDPLELQAANAVVINAGKATYEIKWGAVTYTTGRTAAGSPRAQVDTVAMLRLPQSGKVVQLFYKTGGGSLNTGLYNAIHTPAVYNLPSTATSPGLAVCLKNTADFGMTSTRRSAVFFGQGGGGANITTNYKPGSTLCP